MYNLQQQFAVVSFHCRQNLAFRYTRSDHEFPVLKRNFQLENRQFSKTTPQLNYIASDTIGFPLEVSLPGGSMHDHTVCYVKKSNLQLYGIPCYHSNDTSSQCITDCLFQHLILVILGHISMHVCNNTYCAVVKMLQFILQCNSWTPPPNLSAHIQRG